MKVYEDLIQGSDLWLETRKGVFTASSMGAWVLKEKRTKTDDKAAVKAICKNLAEMSGCELAPIFANWAMTRGTELEPEAREYYEQESGNKVEQVGFCIHDNGGFGCSPDGFIDDRKGMVEIKCPIPDTHVGYIFGEELPDTYKVQVHMQMAVTGASYSDFYSYCPGLPSMLIRVDRDEFTEDLLRGLIRLSAEFKDYKAIMSQKWNDMKSRIESEK